MTWSNKSLQATRDGGFPRRQDYAGQASSAIAEDVNLWLGIPSCGTQPTLSESRHLYHFHRRPYCLGGV
jgi:hypothetical protein